MADELTDAQQASLLQIGGLAQHLWNKDPEFKREFQKAAKTHIPGLSVPEVEARQAAEDAIKPHVEETRKLRAELERRDITDRTEREWQKVYQSGQVSESDRPEVEKLMTERLIGDIGTAAEFYSTQRRLATPRSASTPMRIPSGENFKGLLRDPQRWSREEAYKAVAEIEAARERG